MKNQTVYRGFSQGHSFGLLCAGEMFKEGVVADTVMTKYPFYCMVLVLDGHGKYEDDRGFSFDLSAGSIIQRFPDRKHSIRIEPESHWHEVFAGLGLLEFDDPPRQKERTGGDFWKADIMYPHCNRTMDYLSSLFITSSETPVFSLPGHYLPTREFSNFRERIESSSTGEIHHLVGDGLGLFSRMTHLGRSGSSQKYDPLSQARDLLENRLDERLPVSRILESIPLSYAHLREQFREKQGVSPGQYRIGKRIERACYYLTVEHMTPGETAVKLGYEDTSSFSKQFKKIMALSPGEYCRRHKD
jgi:AraC family transcriptional regulator of arabinose operon